MVPLPHDVDGSGEPSGGSEQTIEGKQEKLVPLVPIQDLKPPVGVGFSDSLKMLNWAAHQFGDIFFE